MNYSPGSQEALACGCICPQEENGFGEGAFKDERGNILFWRNKKCILHGEAKEIDLKKEKENKFYKI